MVMVCFILYGFLLFIVLFFGGGGGGLCVLIGGLWLFCFCLGHFVLCVKIFFRRLLVTF